jgi:hypothetical protein
MHRQHSKHSCVLQPLLGKGVIAYIDVIMIYGKTIEEHNAQLEQVLQLL